MSCKDKKIIKKCVEDVIEYNRSYGGISAETLVMVDAACGDKIGNPEPNDSPLNSRKKR